MLEEKVLSDLKRSIEEADKQIYNGEGLLFLN
jgi:hypothetical protein